MNEKIIQSDGLELEAAMSTNDFLMNFCPNFVLWKILESFWQHYYAQNQTKGTIQNDTGAFLAKFSTDPSLFFWLLRTGLVQGSVFGSVLSSFYAYSQSPLTQ